VSTPTLPWSQKWPTKTVAGTGGGTSTNPAGSSLTTDTPGSISVTAPDSILTPVDTQAIKVNVVDSLTTPGELLTFQIVAH
jgi:hypothetical protein